MRILKSFDTKTDAEELMAAVEKYGEGNVLLVKRHWVKLLTPLFQIILSILMLGLMLYSIYLHLYEESKTLFVILGIFYIYTSISWCMYSIFGILTNIIGQIKAPKKYIDTIKLAELKQKCFEKFLKRTFVTFSVHTLVLLFNATIPFFVIHSTGVGSFMTAIGILFIDGLFLLILNRVMFNIIDYEMNFDICTADSITSYSQKGFFKTNTMNISTSAIKVIQSAKKGIRGSLLEYGNLYIHTDGDLNTEGGKTLELSYIPEPKNLVKRINGMIERKSAYQAV